ncbi:uncharacterized protein LOC131153027 [Malania oleifera]|uniref:uncharacterized protein LOC131153027 n=1 Tax=Malania oleifera TaxID=397392 RepID=UPI0025AE9AE8|nr:uncharacterized protein LOC131153027 [Malania oleifera]
MRELSIICRQYAPVTTFNEPQVAQEQRMVLYMHILEEFDMDILEDDHVRRAVDVQFCNKFKSYRSKIRTHFRAMGDEAEAWPYDKISQEDWDVVCRHFRDPRYQAICETNAANRSKLPTTHCGGAKLFVNHRQAQMVELRDALVLEGSPHIIDFEITSLVLRQ